MGLSSCGCHRDSCISRFVCSGVCTVVQMSSGGRTAREVVMACTSVYGGVSLEPGYQCQGSRELFQSFSMSAETRQSS